jgi:transposase-like protein
MPTGRRYPDEVRRRAVDEVIERGRKPSEVARDLGMTATTLSNENTDGDVDDPEPRGTSGEGEAGANARCHEQRRPPDSCRGDHDSPPPAEYEPNE